MSRRTSSVPPPAGVEERVKHIALALGMLWDGMGGVHAEHLSDGRPIWRVHDQWGGVGGSAVIDAVSGDLLSIEETPLDRDVDVLEIPAAYILSEAEALDYVRARLTALGWPVPAAMKVERDPTGRRWSVHSQGAGPAIHVELEGTRRRVSVRRASRV